MPGGGRLQVGVSADREWLARAEDRIADAEHAVEDRMHAVADRLPDPAAVHQGADTISANGDRHREHARRIRAGDG